MHLIEVLNPPIQESPWWCQLIPKSPSYTFLAYILSRVIKHSDCINLMPLKYFGSKPKITFGLWSYELCTVLADNHNYAVNY